MAELPVIMPKMSMTMEEGTVIAWHKKAGDEVTKGEVLAEVLTDKVDMEVESAHAGVLTRIVAEVDDVVKVGDPIAFIESDQDDLLGDLFAKMDSDAADAAAEKSAAAEANAAPVAVEPVVEEAAPTVGGRVPSTPLARKLAKEAGLDLSQVTPTGPHGTIRVPDVKAAIEAQAASASAPTVTEPVATPAAEAAPVAAVPAVAPAAPAAPAAPEAAPEAEPKAAVAKPATEKPAAAPAATGELFGDSGFQRSRKAVTRSMQPSADVPQFTAYRSINIEALAAVRKTSLKGISWTTIIVRALALALREYPQMNSYWTENGVVANEDVGVTLAVDTEHGLMIPVLVNPDQKTLGQLNTELFDVVEQARNKRMDIAALKKATTTVSNMGGLGVDRFNALITVPQATALSMGAISKVPVWNEETGKFEPVMQIQLGLTTDHRVGDGADAARILQSISDNLADPIKFLA